MMTGGLGRRPRTVSASPRYGPLPHTPLRSSSLHGEDFPRTLIRGSPDGTIEPRRATIEAVAYSRNSLQQPGIPVRGVTTTKEPTDGRARRDDDAAGVMGHGAAQNCHAHGQRGRVTNDTFLVTRITHTDTYLFPIGKSDTYLPQPPQAPQACADAPPETRQGPRTRDKQRYPSQPFRTAASCTAASVPPHVRPRPCLQPACCFLSCICCPGDPSMWAIHALRVLFVILATLIHTCPLTSWLNRFWDRQTLKGVRGGRYTRTPSPV